jgi:hypothetical protein
VAAKLTGMSRDAHYKRLKRENDPAGEYRQAFEKAREEFRDRLRHEAIRRGMLGIKRPIMYGGAQVMQENGETREKEPMWHIEYSDRMLILLLKAYCPEFHDKHEIIGANGGHVKVIAVRYPLGMEDPMQQLGMNREAN